MTGIIYKATNTFNGKVYIGQTVAGLPKRKSQHYRDAKADSDNAFHLALYQYPNAFEWETIDTFSGTKEQVIHALNVAEEYHILKHKSTDAELGYNATYGGYSSDKFADHIRERAKVRQGTAKAVLQYDLDGNFIREFPSLSAVSAFLNREKSSPCELITGIHYHSQWRMKENEYFPRNIGKCKPGVGKKPYMVQILVYGNDGELIGLFPSTKDASEKTGVPMGYIISRSFGRYPQDISVKEANVRDFYFFRLPENGSYPKSIRVSIIQKKQKSMTGREKTARPIAVYTLDGKHYRDFEKASMAESALGVNASTIRDYCNREEPIVVRSNARARFVYRWADQGVKPNIQIIVETKKPKYNSTMEHRIIQYSLDGEFVQVWENTNRAAEAKADTTALIRRSLRGEPSRKANFQWRYYSEDYPDRIEPASKPEKAERAVRPDDIIEEIDWTGKVIATYRNTADAARKTGCSQSYVCNALAGKIKHPKHRFLRANAKL